MGRAKTSDYGNQFIGIYGVCGEHKLLLGTPCSSKLENACREALDVEVHRMTVDGSGLLGIFCAMNSNGIIVPEQASTSEKAAFKKLGLNVHVLKGRLSACGNNLVINDKGGVANPEVPAAELKKIGECLGIELVSTRIAGYPTVGAACMATNKGFLAHTKTSAAELEMLEGALKVKGAIGSLNVGMPFVRLCALVNSKGYVVGESTTGFEMGRLEEALDFIG
ncbi:Translation initiation factor 6 [Candidatus Burarchaeum australiense]|nr:Translation initiation factor 6 [Candidatus Burarchaeum australiense]